MHFVLDLDQLISGDSSSILLVFPIAWSGIRIDAMAKALPTTVVQRASGPTFQMETSSGVLSGCAFENSTFTTNYTVASTNFTYHGSLSWEGYKGVTSRHHKVLWQSESTHKNNAPRICQSDDAKGVNYSFTIKFTTCR
jgi:hypothetical protein